MYDYVICKYPRKLSVKPMLIINVFLRNRLWQYHQSPLIYNKPKKKKKISGSSLNLRLLFVVKSEDEMGDLQQKVHKGLRSVIFSCVECLKIQPPGLHPNPLISECLDGGSGLRHISKAPWKHGIMFYKDKNIFLDTCESVTVKLLHI